MKVPDTKDVLSLIMSYPDAKETFDYARKSCYGPTYLVGGKVYRTLIEMMTGRDVNAQAADWDFLCMGKIKVKAPKRGWAMTGSLYGYGKRSRNIRRVQPISRSLQGKIASKIDLVSMADVMAKVGFPNSQYVSDYLRAVPLDIQAIGLDFESQQPQIHGSKAIEAIRCGRIAVNNPDGKILAVPMHQYINDKAISIGFTAAGLTSIVKVPCNCFPGDSKTLWQKGCQAPGLHN